MNGLNLSLTRSTQGNTVAIYRNGRHVVTHPADGLGLLPGFAHGTELTSEEACWAMQEAARLATGAKVPSPWPVAIVLATVLVVAFLAGLACLSWERPPCDSELGVWAGCE
jgi:hypothetical protein